MKKLRLAQEQADREELEKVLTSLDLTWEEKKSWARELEEKKRRRPSEVEGGEKPPKRLKKLKFEVIKEDWGEQMCDETGEQGATVIDGGGAEDSGEQEAGECSNVTRPCKIMRLASTNLTTSLITEYFPKTKRMEQQTGFEEEE